MSGFHVFGGTTVEDIKDRAEQEGIPSHVAAIKAQQYSAIRHVDAWPEIKEFNPSIMTTNLDIYTRGNGELLSAFVSSVAESIQFPKNTAYLFALGCVSAAMRNFRIEGFKKDKPLRPNIYVVAAQPPSTGKSGVYDYLFDPIDKAYREMNSRTEKERRLLQMKAERLEKSISKYGASDEPASQDQCEQDLDELYKVQKRLAEIPYITPTITNTTVEALEAKAIHQGCYFNIVSDEAGAANVVLGAVYGDSSSKKNSDLILKAWTHGTVSSARVSREGGDGRFTGVISVLAQYDTVDTILEAGANGSGLSERFLLLAENSLLGKRDLSKTKKVNDNLINQYEVMIDNIVSSPEVHLTFSKDAKQWLINCKVEFESMLGEDGDYSQDLFAGFLGKNETQVRKLAAILHICENWKEGGKRSLVIDDDTVIMAIGIFRELSKTFVDAANRLGYAGNETEVNKVIDKLTNIASGNNARLKVSIASFQSGIKNVKPFKGMTNLRKKLKDKLLPILQDLGYCHVEGQDIYINPRLK